MKRAAPFLIPIVAGACVFAGLRSGSTAEQVLPRPAIPAATRGPLAIRFTPDGRLAAVTEADTGTLAVVDTKTGRVTRRFPTGGEGPGGLALAPDGDALVANGVSGSVARLDLSTGKREALAPLRGEPAEVVLSKDARLVFVSLPARDEVAVLVLPDLSLRQRITVGRRPRAMALTPDGRTLLVANLQGGDVSLVDTAGLREERRIPTTGVNLRGITIAPDGYRAYVTGQIPANTRSTDDPLDMWTNTVFTINIRPGVTFNTAEGWLDFTLASSPDPQGIVALEQEKVAVTLSGCDQALLVRTPGPHLPSLDPFI
jgi:YVTN family beta-propeller protein